MGTPSSPRSLTHFSLLSTLCHLCTPAPTLERWGDSLTRGQREAGPHSQQRRQVDV